MTVTLPCYIAAFRLLLLHAHCTLTMWERTEQHIDRQWYRIYCRYVLGEGIEKKEADLSADIEEQKKSFEEAAAKKAAAAAETQEVPAAEADAATEAKPTVQVWLSLCLLFHLVAVRRFTTSVCCSTGSRGSVSIVRQLSMLTRMPGYISSILVPFVTHWAFSLDAGVGEGGQGAAREERRWHDGLQEGAGRVRRRPGCRRRLPAQEGSCQRRQEGRPRRLRGRCRSVHPRRQPVRALE